MSDMTLAVEMVQGALGKDPHKVTLERLVDEVGIEAVLTALQDVCLDRITIDDMKWHRISIALGRMAQDT